MNILLPALFFILWCQITNGLPPSTGILANTLWTDDFDSTKALSKWNIYSDNNSPTNKLFHSELILTTDSKTYHGPFYKDAKKGFTWMQRTFVCGTPNNFNNWYSNVYVYYSFAFCETGSSDNSRLYPMDYDPMTQTHLQNTGMKVTSGTYVTETSHPGFLAKALPYCNTADGTINTAKAWAYKTKQRGKFIGRGYGGWQRFNVSLRVRTSAIGEYAVLYDIAVECRGVLYGDEHGVSDVSLEKKRFYQEPGFGYILIVLGVILFVLINNVFIGYWCVCKRDKINPNVEYGKCESVNVDNE
eukprot:24480_1